MLALFTHLALLTSFTAPTAAADTGLKPGTYKGPAVVTLNNAEAAGRLTMTVTSVDERGKVKGTVRGSNGLYGAGDITGTVDEAGVFKFKGTVTQNLGGVAVVWKVTGKAKVKDGKVKGTYLLESNYYGVITEADAKFEVKLVAD